MGNLGKYCDMQSCHLCDTCIYDEELNNEKDMAEVKPTATKRYYCNGCEFLKKLKVDSTKTVYNNLYCKNCQTANTQKLIDISVPENRMVNAPKWCPINKELNNGEETTEIKGLPSPSTISNKKTWYTLEAQVQFEDIKVGDVFHVPPFESHARQDIVITNKTDYSATYKVISQNDQYANTVSTLWPNTLLLRMITRHKIMEIKYCPQK